MLTSFLLCLGNFGFCNAIGLGEPSVAKTASSTFLVALLLRCVLPAPFASCGEAMIVGFGAISLDLVFHTLNALRASSFSPTVAALGLMVARACGLQWAHGPFLLLLQ